MPDGMQVTPAVEDSLGYWDLMDATNGSVPSDWSATTDPASTPSGFETVSADEDLVEDGSSLQSRQLLDFIKQEANHHDLDFTKVLYHPTLPHEVRVLRIAPGRYQQPLVAALEHISVKFDYPDVVKRWRWSAHFGLSFSKNKKVPYTAISYYWGEGDFVCPIVVSDHHLKITQTLDDILRHLREETKSVTVWVDQLCIDQSSNSDKESQVKLMGVIYSRARNTIIWLGNEPGREAFKALRKLALDTTGVRPDLSAEEIDQYRHPFGIWAEYAQGTKDLRVLLCQPWFRRTWVIQEAVLSRDVYLMTGHDTISWEDFAGDCAKTAEYGIFDDEDNTHTNQVSGRKSGWVAAAEIYYARTDHVRSNGGGSLLQWLVNTRYADVTQPVDKIYGILGLLRQTDITPNYTKSKEQLYWEVALHILRPRLDELERHDWKISHQNVIIFLCCVDHDTDPASSRLPSWVPDWSQPRLTTSLAYSAACLSYYPSSNPTGHRAFSLSGDDKRLSVTAGAADLVVHLSDVFLDTELTLDISPTNNASLRHCIEFFNKPSVSKRYNESGLWTTFCSTLVAGRDHTGYQKCPDDYIETLSFLCDLTSARTPTFVGQIYTARQKKPEGKGHLTVHHFSKRSHSRRLESLKGAYQNAILNRRLCWTANGHVALVPRFTREGDTIFRLPGAVIPFVLRRAQRQEYRLVGECYSLSLMEECAKVASSQEYSTIDVV